MTGSDNEPPGLVSRKPLVIDLDADGKIVGTYRCPLCGQELPSIGPTNEYMPCNGYYVRIIVRNAYVINEQALT